MNGVCLWMYLPRKEISTEDIIELMHELMLFKPTGFRSSQKARQFRRLGCKNIWEQFRINPEQDAMFKTTVSLPPERPSGTLSRSCHRYARSFSAAFGRRIQHGA